MSAVAVDVRRLQVSVRAVQHLVLHSDAPAGRGPRMAACPRRFVKLSQIIAATLGSKARPHLKSRLSSSEPRSLSPGKCSYARPTARRRARQLFAFRAAQCATSMPCCAGAPASGKQASTMRQQRCTGAGAQRVGSVAQRLRRHSQPVAIALPLSLMRACRLERVTSQSRDVSAAIGFSIGEVDSGVHRS